MHQNLDVVARLTSLLSDNFLTSKSSLQPYYQNVTEFATPKLLGVALPDSVKKVQEVLATLNEIQTPFYVSTTGKNWGLGSRVALGENFILISLAKLTKIRCVNEDLRYAVIDAGVTQQQLSDYLAVHHPNYLVTVTGSSPHSAVISNMLERGTSFSHHRVKELRNLEVVLNDGQVFKTGFWESEEDTVGKGEELHYTYGNGPDVMGLFVQSNLGVVTGAVVDLQPKPESQYLLWATVKDSQFSGFIDKVRALYRHGALDRIIHIGNDKRMKIQNKNTNNENTWTAMSAIHGPKVLVEARKELIERAIGSFSGDLHFITREDSLAEEPTMRQMMDLHEGKPATVFIEAMYKSEGEDRCPDNFEIDYGPVGMLCVLPIVPMIGTEIRRVIDAADKIAASYGYLLASTINPVNDLYAEFVLNIYFDRNDPEDVKKAHTCKRELHVQLAALGVRFYRLDIEEQKVGYDNRSLRDLKTKLKAAFDPNGLNSAGKYNIW